MSLATLWWIYRSHVDNPGPLNQIPTINFRSDDAAPSTGPSTTRVDPVAAVLFFGLVRYAYLTINPSVCIRTRTNVSGS